ncbi:MAG: helix-turn-helix transcriptional regulator [Clostridiales bacterium]|nr:helix-turn-helix transcriptional regulator [Clostridiales bacterium]
MNKYNDCPLTFTMKIIGGKWRLPILWAIHKQEVIRYNELKRQIEGITNMMLTQSLKELESYGLLIRKQYPEIPPRVEYMLSEDGKTLIPSLKQLAEWGKLMQQKITQSQAPF